MCVDDDLPEKCAFVYTLRADILFTLRSARN